MNKLAIIFKSLKLPRMGGVPRAETVWLILLALTLAALALSVAWNISYFAKALADQSATPPSAVSAGDASALMHAREAVEARAEEEAQYRNGYLFVDPSR